LLWLFVYLMLRNLFALVSLLARPRGSKEFEILLLPSAALASLRGDVRTKCLIVSPR
jgi:hypothetical protein